MRCFFLLTRLLGDTTVFFTFSFLGEGLALTLG
jgi:hypothetical protein